MHQLVLRKSLTLELPHGEKIHFLSLNKTNALIPTTEDGTTFKLLFMVHVFKSPSQSVDNFASFWKIGAHFDRYGIFVHFVLPMQNGNFVI